MKRDQFGRDLKDDCERLSRTFRIERSEGKGSHCRVYVGQRNTIVKSGELSPLYRQIVRKQLNLR